MIDLTLSDSDDEIIGLGGVPQQQQHAGGACAATKAGTTAVQLSDLDSDDDRPLHEIKAEILQRSSQQQSSQPHTAPSSQQCSQQQPQQPGTCSQQQQGSPQERKRPPRKLVSKKVAAAAAAGPQPASQSSPGPPAAAAGNGFFAVAKGKENTSPQAAAAAAAEVRPASGGGGLGGEGSSRVRCRSGSCCSPHLTYDDDLPLPDWMHTAGGGEGGGAGVNAAADDDDAVLPLHKRIKTQQQQQQQQEHPRAMGASPTAPTAAKVAAAAAAGDPLSDDDDVVLCWESPAPPAAGGGRGNQDRTGITPTKTAAAAAEEGIILDDDSFGDDFGLGGRNRRGKRQAAAAGGLWGGCDGPDDCMWEPSPAAAGGDSSSDGTAAAASAGGGGGGFDDEDWCLSDDSYGGGSRKVRSKQQPKGRQRATSSRGTGSTAAVAAAAGSGGGGEGAGSGGGRGGGGRVRLTAEERAAERERKAAAKQAEKDRKTADKMSAKLAKQAEAQAQKDAKRLDAFINRKVNGRFGEYECVVVMDTATSASALGLAISTELERCKTMAWQVAPSLPLSGRWPGCSCFCFKRRKMCEADDHALKTASTARVDVLREDVDGRPPYVQLVFEQPTPFLTQLQTDSLTGLMAAVKASHPDCSLGVVVLGLKAHIRRVETQGLRQGGGAAGGVCLDWRRVSQQLLQLHLTTPGLQLRLLSKQEEAAAHIINTARALGQQPYSSESQLEACGGSGPGAASKAAAGAMSTQLGPTTAAFAVSTLGRMHGMGGNKAWAIAQTYPSFGALISAFEKAPHNGAPSLLLADLMEPDAAGKARPRRVGPTMSKRLHLLLTCEDPDALVEAAGEAAD